MMTADGHSSISFGRLYAAANVGVFICFIPLISLILPQRAMAIAPAASVQLLSQALLLGGIASSIANIAAGWVSDRMVGKQGSRLPLIGIGFGFTIASLVALDNVSGEAGFIMSFVIFQLAFNTLFSPFNALAADHIADREKGRVFGWLSLGLPLSQIVVLGLVWQRVDASGAWLWIIIATATLLILPLLLFGRRMAGVRITTVAQTDQSLGRQEADVTRQLRRDFTYAWFGRLFIQCAAAGSTSFMLIHLATLPTGARAGATMNDLFSVITAVSLGAGLSVGLIVGLWSDRSRRRRPFLFVASLLVALGFAIMSGASSSAILISGFTLFSVGFAGFLTIDGVIIAEIVGNQQYRASRLGIINLSNTLPTMAVPAIALMISKSSGNVTSNLFFCIAIGALISAWATSQIRSIS